MTTPKEIQAVLDRARAIEIAAYIQRRNKRRPDAQATLAIICTRFRLNQTEVKRIIDSVEYLDLSNFAYKPPADDSWAAQMLAAWHPQWWEDAPDGKRLVVVIEADSGPRP